MISAKLLNSNASLNDYLYVGQVEFIPGENVTVAFQIFLTELGIRYIPPVAATITLTFIDSDGNDLDIAATKIDPDDRSMWKVAISQVQSETLSGQNIIGKLDVNGDATVIYYFLIANGIVRINLSGDC